MHRKRARLLAAFAVLAVAAGLAAGGQAASASAPVPAVTSLSPGIPGGLEAMAFAQYRASGKKSRTGGALTAAMAAAFIKAGDQQRREIRQGIRPALTYNPGYEYSSAFVASPGSVTSGSVTETDVQQGTRNSAGEWGLGHSLGNLAIHGTCASGNTACISGGAPEMELISVVGGRFCNNGSQASDYAACLYIDTWKNGTWTQTSGYVDDSSGATPNSGYLFPQVPMTGGGSHTIGFQLGTVEVNVLLDGTRIGHVPYTYWGQSAFGPLSTLTVQSEAFEYDQTWPTTPFPSMNYTFSGFTDSAGSGLGTVNVSSDYSVSGTSSTGWTVSGGNSPSDSGAYSVIEASDDNGYCLKVSGATYQNAQPVVTSQCSSTDEAELWRYDSSTGHVINQSGYCLWDPNDSVTNGTQFEIDACGSGHGEIFSPSDNPLLSSGYNTYTDYTGTVCMDNKNNTQSNGNPVQVYACNAGTSQQWDKPYLG